MESLRISIPSGVLEVEIVVKNIPEVLKPEEFEAISEITRLVKGLQNKGIKEKEIIDSLRTPVTNNTESGKRKYVFKDRLVKRTQNKVTKEFVQNYADETKEMNFKTRFENYASIFGSNTLPKFRQREIYMRHKNTSEKWGVNLNHLEGTWEVN